MDRGPLELGTADGLWFRVLWRDNQASPDAETATDGLIEAGIGDVPIWDGPEGLRWSWVDLLMHLATNWPRLLIEEMDPLGVAEPHPGKLRAAAEQRWEAMPAERGEQEDDALCRFEMAHDLAAGLPGLDAAPFWFLRQGMEAVVGHPDRPRKLPFARTVSVIEELGQAIAERLAGVDGQRALAARAQWQDRQPHFNRNIIRLATWQTDDVIDELLSAFQPEQLLRIIDGTPEVTPILAAARMAGDALSPSMIRVLMLRLADYPAQPTPDLDLLAREAEETFQEESFDRDYEFGYSLAQWLREHSTIVGPTGRVDPERALKEWQVAVDDIDLATPGIDAVAAWGRQTGPVVVVNRRGNRARFPTGRRAVLAHELCHLLIDRRRALPAAEVLGGRVSQPAERRANAFAAELLLPRTIAGGAAAQAENVRAAVHSISTRFGVSFELAAWQIWNSGVNLSAEDISQLRRWVREPIPL